jgi:hypothetical protein
MIGGLNYCPPLLYPNFCFESIRKRVSQQCAMPDMAPGAASGDCPGMSASMCDATKLAWFRMAQQRNCAQLYISLRGLLPQHIYEGLGSIWQDYLKPVSEGGAGGDPERPPVEYCQPLIRGDQADRLFRYATCQDPARRANQAPRKTWSIPPRSTNPGAPSSTAPSPTCCPPPGRNPTCRA